MSHAARAAGGLVAAALLVVSCGDGATTDTDTTEPPAASGVTASSAPTVTDPTFTPVTADSIVAPGTTAAPESGAATTLAPPSRSELVLRSNGVGAVDFGQPDVKVIPYVTAVLGAPTTDQLGEFPTFDEESFVYVNFEEDAFAFPFSRTTCYDNQYCVYFGGEAAEALAFVGWSQEDFDRVTDPLQTADGITVGSRQSDHIGVMTVNEGGCFSSGSGEAGGVTLIVTSEGEPFESVDEAGNFVVGNPDPSDIVVQSMESGERPFFLFADC